MKSLIPLIISSILLTPSRQAMPLKEVCTSTKTRDVAFIALKKTSALLLRDIRRVPKVTFNPLRGGNHSSLRGLFSYTPVMSASFSTNLNCPRDALFSYRRLSYLSPLNSTSSYSFFSASSVGGDNVRIRHFHSKAASHHNKIKGSHFYRTYIDQDDVDSIENVLASSYGLKASNIIHLDLGADMSASTYKVNTGSGPTYLVKLKLGHINDISALLSDFLHHAGIEQVIPFLKTLDGRFTHRLGSSTIMVRPFIEGRNGFGLTLTDNQWFTLGKLMRQIHDISLPVKIQKRIRSEKYSSNWRNTVNELLPLIESNSNSKQDIVANNFLNFLKGHVTVIRHLVERAEHLAQESHAMPLPKVLCHSDMHAGNIIIDETGKFFLIDWDNPIIAPKERDLMFIGGGVGNTWNEKYEEKLFYNGYEGRDLNPKLLAYYRYERIVEDIAQYAHLLLQSTEGGKDRIKWYKEFVAQFEPKGVVEIALNTDLLP